MPQPKDDLSRSLVALDQHSSLIAVVELSLSTWLVGGMVPGIERDPLKKLVPDEDGLLKLLHRWRDEAVKAGHQINRMVVAFEAGRDGFWLARWLRSRGIEAYVIHPTSVAVSREHRRAKTDRLDIALLKRSLLGWLRGEKKHCSMAAIPTLEEEDAKRPNREREQLVGKRTGIVNRMKAALVRLGIRGFNPKLRKAPQQLATLRTPEGGTIPPNTLAELQREMAHLSFINEHIKQIEDARLIQLKQAPQHGSNAKVVQLGRINGIGIETADMLANEVFSRDLRDQRAVARYAGLTGSPDESGRRRREKGLAKAGNARVRRGMIQLAWRFLFHQRNSALTQWYRQSVAAGKKRTTVIVALARKLLIALWRFVTIGDVPQGVILRTAS
jgi:transposase